MLTALIVAAGSSRRVGFDKLIQPLDGKPVLEYSVDAFERTESVSQIIVVTRTDKIGDLKRLLKAYAKVKDIVSGGEHRQDSVRAGLDHVDAANKFIAVHDAARPLITPEQIERVFAAAQEHGAASLAEPVSDTLKRADSDLRVIESVERENLYGMQTPQVFKRVLLHEAYQLVEKQKARVTDEVSAVERMGHKVVLVPAGEANFKITYERDLQMAELILQTRGG